MQIANHLLKDKAPHSNKAENLFKEKKLQSLQTKVPALRLRDR